MKIGNISSENNEKKIKRKKTCVNKKVTLCKSGLGKPKNDFSAFYVPFIAAKNRKYAFISQKLRKATTN